MTRKVGIYGSATTALRTVPVPGEDDSWEVWSIGLYDRGGAARMFEMHPDPVILRAEDGGRLARLQAAECPVYMQRTWPEIPRSVAYPKAEIKAALGIEGMDIFGGTGCYMFAMAVAELTDGDVIGLFGLEMLHDSPHGSHRAAMWALRNEARHRGIVIVTPPESTLFREAEYGAETITGLSVEVLQAMKDEYTRQRDRARTELHTFNGCVQAVDKALEAARHIAQGGKAIW